MAMDLVDRYIQAVRFWLPAGQREDIAAELSEDIKSQIEEKEASLGRQFSEAELAQVIKSHGRPVIVANRFRPQQYLIGPVLFPIYRFVLKIVAVFFMLPWSVAWLGVAMSRAAHSGDSLAGVITGFWTAFWPMASFLLGSVTAVFAILERTQEKSHFLDRWDPRKLPPMRDPRRIPLANSLIEITANFIFITWLIAGAWYQTTLHFSSFSIQLAPEWKYFFWGLLGLGLVNMTAAGVNLFRPYWTWTRAGMRVASTCAGGVLFCWLLKANIVRAIAVAGVPPEKTAQIAQAINWWAAMMFPFAIIACITIVAMDSYRFLGLWCKSGSSALNVASGTC